jgi:hypothetical protein
MLYPRFLIAALLVAPLACSDDTINTAGGAAPGGGNAGAAGPAGGGQVGGNGAGQVGGGQVGGNGTAGGGGVQPPTEIAPCQNQIFECGDLIDNDNDGLLDSLDPDCLGPCDNTEDSYFPDLPSNTNNSCKLDCYWDAGDGSGDDECYWSHECDPNNVAPDFYPSPWINCEYIGEDGTTNPPGQTCGELYATQSKQCLNFCGPLTPNGCDCFGCCELPALSGSFVFVGSVGENEDTQCTLADVGNPDLCHPCLPVAGCLNDCDPCEICIGHPEPEPGCEGEGGAGAGGGSGGQQCPDGVQECGLSGQDPCPSSYACITGCCYAVPE